MSKSAAFVLVLLCALLLAGCSAGGSDGGRGRTSGGATVPRVGPSGKAVAAFSGVGAADRRASEWSEGARLYAISAEGTNLDAGGRAPGWLYSYVSRSAGGIEIVAVRGGKASVNAKQKLPEAEIKDISSHVLPPVSKMTDSPEAMSRTRRVQQALKTNPRAGASAGLDSFSGGVNWIFATVEGGQRVEERVPALSK